MYAFRLKPPNGNPFFGAIVDQNGKATVLSTRDGTWQPELAISAADMLLPEFDLNEWEVSKIDPSEAPPLKTDDQQTSGGPTAPTAVRAGTVNLYRQRIGGFGWKPDKPDIRDQAYSVSRYAGVVEVTKATLPGADKFLPPIRDQGDQGSCTGHSSRTGMQYKLAAENQHPGELSPRFTYYNGRLIEGTTNQDGGAEIRDVIKGIAKLGITLEALCPYNANVYAQRPSPNAYKEALTDRLVQYKRIDADQDSASRQPAIKQAIIKGSPIVFGFTVYENFMSEEVARTGLMPLPTGKVDGGHAICAVAFDDTLKGPGWTGGIQIANSWGDQWGCQGANGQRGYFWMPWDLVTNSNFCDDMWAIDLVQ